MYSNVCEIAIDTRECFPIRIYQLDNEDVVRFCKIFKKKLLTGMENLFIYFLTVERIFRKRLRRSLYQH